MTRVLASNLYGWPMHNDSATYEDCGAAIDIPDVDDPDADFEAPHWRREPHFEPCEDTFEALCDECYAEAVAAIINQGE